MEQPLSLQAVQFLWAAAFGAVYGLSYDLLRGLRRSLRGLTQLLDLLFVLVLLLGNCLFALYPGGGSFRIFMPIGMLVGTCLYFLLLSPWILRGVSGFWRLATWPIRAFGRLCKKFLLFCKKMSKRPFQAEKNRLQ